MAFFIFPKCSPACDQSDSTFYFVCFFRGEKIATKPSPICRTINQASSSVADWIPHRSPFVWLSGLSISSLPPSKSSQQSMASQPPFWPRRLWFIQPPSSYWQLAPSCWRRCFRRTGSVLTADPSPAAPPCLGPLSSLQKKNQGSMGRGKEAITFPSQEMPLRWHLIVLAFGGWLGLAF